MSSNQDAFNFHIAQGTDFNLYTQLLTEESGQPVDITGFTWQAQLRTYYTSQPFIAFNIIPVAPLNQGQIILNLTRAQTVLLTAPRYLYDLFGTNTIMNTTDRYLNGVVHVDFRVTQ